MQEFLEFAPAAFETPGVRRVLTRVQIGAPRQRPVDQPGHVSRSQLGVNAVPDAVNGGAPITGPNHRPQPVHLG